MCVWHMSLKDLLTYLRKCRKIDKMCPWLKYRDQIGRNTSKTIPRLISVVFSVCTEQFFFFFSNNAHSSCMADTSIMCKMIVPAHRALKQALRVTGFCPSNPIATCSKLTWRGCPGRPRLLLTARSLQCTTRHRGLSGLRQMQSVVATYHCCLCSSMNECMHISPIR